MDQASHASLENEFGTKNQDEWFKRILREGEAQTKTVHSTYPPAHLTHVRC